MISKEEEEWERKDKMLARRGMTTATEVMLENDIDELRATVKSLRAELLAYSETAHQRDKLLQENARLEEQLFAAKKRAGKLELDLGRFETIIDSLRAELREDRK